MRQLGAMWLRSRMLALAARGWSRAAAPLLVDAFVLDIRKLLAMNDCIFVVGDLRNNSYSFV